MKNKKKNLTEDDLIEIAELIFLLNEKLNLVNIKVDIIAKKLKLI